MPAPKGHPPYNKKGQEGGRPGLDRERLMKEFVEWAKDNPEALTVPCFCAPRGFSSDTMITWANEDETFRQAYNTGKELIGINRLKATLVNKQNDEDKNKLDKSIYMQTIGNYDRDVRNYQREEKKFEQSLKVEEQKCVSDDLEKRYEQTIALLERMQNHAKHTD